MLLEDLILRSQGGACLARLLAYHDQGGCFTLVLHRSSSSRKQCVCVLNSKT